MPTLEEDILGMLRHFNAMSRRHHRPNDSGHSGSEDEEHTANPPEMEKKHHGRGRLVALLMDNGPMVQSQIAACLGIRPQSLSELICKVEAEGLVTRRQSEEDKRQTIVSLTEKGREHAETFRAAHRQHAGEVLAPLNEDEKMQFAELLKKLIDARREQEN